VEKGTKNAVRRCGAGGNYLPVKAWGGLKRDITAWPDWEGLVLGSQARNRYPPGHLGHLEGSPWI